jgi:hypothetical protein
LNFFKKIEKLKKRVLKKLEAICRFLIETEFKKIKLMHSTKFDEGETEGKIVKKKENDWFLIMGNPRVLPSRSRAVSTPALPFLVPPPLDFAVFGRCVTGPIYRLGLAVNQCYQPDYRCDGPVLVHRGPVSASLLVHLHNLPSDLL